MGGSSRVLYSWQDRDGDENSVQKGWTLQGWESPEHECYSTVADSEWGTITQWCFLSTAHIFPHSQKHTHQKSIEILQNQTRKDPLVAWTQPPAFPSNPLIQIRTLSISTLINILYYSNLNEISALSWAPPFSLSYLGPSSCKQLQNLFSAQLSSKTPPATPGKNLGNVLATHALRLLSIMFINIVSSLLIPSRQPVPSAASCDLCRLSSSQQQLCAFSCACTQHHQCSPTAPSPKATIVQKINQINEEIPLYLLLLALPFVGGAPGQTTRWGARQVVEGDCPPPSAQDGDVPQTWKVQKKWQKPSDAWRTGPKRRSWGWWACFICGGGHQGKIQSYVKPLLPNDGANSALWRQQTGQGAQATKCSLGGSD